MAGYCVCYRYRHEIAHDGQRIYILGGGTSWTSYPLDKVPVINKGILTKRVTVCACASQNFKFKMFITACCFVHKPNLS